MKKTFRQLIQEKEFIITWELVPGRGSWEDTHRNVLKLADQAAIGKKVHAVSLTENPGGKTGIQPEVIGREIAELGMESIIHITCKDKNRSQLESHLYALERLKLNNLLVISGDYATESILGCPKPVFDIDSTHLLKLITEMNSGIEFSTPRGKTRIKPSNFFPGAAVSPFKATEAEQMLQYSKLKKKIENGAQYIITQIGYDARKYHELLLYVNTMKWKVPLIGNIFMVDYPAARIMNKNNIPGCVVTDKLLAQLEQENQSCDKGIAVRMERAAKLFAVLKGMGYQGVHLGGLNVTYEQIEYVISRGEELLPNWKEYVSEFDYPQDQGFYIFEKNNETGLNQEKMSDSPENAQKKTDINYKISRGFHKLFFVPGKKFFPVMQKLSSRLEGRKLEKYFHGIERISKEFMYNCQDCGDCALTDVAYVCPMGDCPKNQRNGPCEGSYYGWCEVYPGKRQCVWVKAYQRLKNYHEEKQLNSYPVSPYNWKLQHTSSWINYYTGKDHSAERLGIQRGNTKEQSK
ncbi:MAG: methylenetetrahydrofolate reductase [Peptococcaceae bacterium]|nr:methylenetetrahydrofolate reductase [Peptococcaceae bacterium]